MNRRDFLTTGAAGIVGASLAGGDLQAGVPQPRSGADTSHPATAERPNIIVLITDQQRAALSRRSGYPLDVTPSLDRIASGGVDFTNAYVTFPACVPSRTSMLTGRWPSAHHVRMNLAPKEAYFAKDVYQVAREQGYRTALIGKNHTYLEKTDLDYWSGYFHEGGTVSPGASPKSGDFDRWLAGLQYNVALKPSPYPVETQLPYRIISDAIGFMDENRARPFLLQISIPEPHDPEQVPRPYWDLFPPDQVPERNAGPEALARLGPRARWLYHLQQTAFPDTEKHWRRYVSNYLGSLRLIDDQVARLTQFMQRSGLLEKTVIVCLSDHGDYLMEYGLSRKGVGLPECLTQIPMVWSGPGIRQSERLGKSAFVSMADVMPTLCEIMGADIPEGVQGRSLWPLLRGESYPGEEFRSVIVEGGLGGLYHDAPDETPVTVAIKPGSAAWDELNGVTQAGTARMLRMGEWKLIYDMMGYGQLYHLPTDPTELNNRFGNADVAREQAELMAELAMWTIRNQDSLPTGPQDAKYRTQWARPHNWYAPHRHGVAPVAYIP